MNINFFESEEGPVIAMQESWDKPTYFIPAVKIQEDNEVFFVPAVSTFNQINTIPAIALGFFKPQSPKSLNALFSHNIRHYRADQQAATQARQHVDVRALEKIADEVARMQDLGIAFK